MSDLTVRPVHTRREKQLFLEFPWELYHGDPNWVPPLRDNQKEMVNYKANPFYERNVIQTFLAYRGDKVCGRIAGILNRGHNERFNERRGFFGFFECVDDQEAATALFHSVRQWFADQGIYCLRGPANPSLNHEVGLLVDGFDSPPNFMMTYNPPYYQRLIENCGFKKTQDLYAFYGHVSILPKIQSKLEPIAQQIIERYDVRLRTLNTKRFLDEVLMFLSIYNRSLVNTWGFVPMSDAEVRHTAKSLKLLIVPELAVAAEVDGQVVGVAFCLPDFNTRIREIDGKLFPFGFIHLLRRKSDIKRVRVISTNVIPEYQRYGIGLTLMHGLVPKAMDWGLQEAEFSWVLESNSLSRGALSKGGAKITKTYRLYDLDEPPPAAPAPAPRRSQFLPAVRRPQGRLEVREVHGRSDLEQFIRLPWEVYAGDPQWVPPLILEVKEFLDRKKHPFYRFGEATQLLATRDGKPVGRVLVSHDPRTDQVVSADVGCFGMFEAMDDPEAAHALLEGAADWLRQRGCTTLRGPIDYSLNYPCGLLVDGFDTPPRIMMNHGRIYYADLLESWGLGKAKDLYAWWFNDSNDMLAKWRERAERIARRTGVTVRPFDRSRFDEDLDRCKQVYNPSMGEQWGFSMLSDEEFRYMSERIAKIAHPDQVLLAEKDGRPIGFAVTLPDVNEAIRPLNGRLTRWGLPINLVRLLSRMKRIKTARMLVLDVLAEHRRRGVAELLILKTLDYGKNVLKYTGAELSWTLEDNPSVNQAIEAVGGRKYKTYRIYEKKID